MKRLSLFIATAMLAATVGTLANAESYRMRYVHGNSASAGAPRSRNAKVANQNRIGPAQRVTIGKFSVGWFSPASSSFSSPVKAAMTRAFQRWSERLQGDYKIYIDVTLEEMAPDLYAECYVEYKTTSETSCLPSSLFWNRPNHPTTARPTWENDAEILINSVAQWDFSTDMQSPGTGMHLETMALRCIAQALGHGITLLYDSGGVIPGKDQLFTNLCGDNVLGPYEKLIFEKYGERLIDYDVTSKEFERFVQPEDQNLRYILYSDTEYQLYAPNFYDDTKSLGLSRNPNSLMWCEMDKGDRFFEIDNVTKAILKEIGWDLNDKKDFDVRIYNGSTMNGNYTNVGMLGAYGRYTINFRNNGLGSLSDLKLRLNLFEENGVREALLIDGKQDFVNRGRLTFDIGDSVYSEKKTYRKTPGGELEAEFVLDYKLNGVTMPAKIFRLALDARPVLNSISRTGGFATSNKYYTATFSLEGQHIKDAFCEIDHGSYITYQQPSRETVRDPQTGKFLYYQYSLVNLNSDRVTHIKIHALNEYGRSASMKEWDFDPANPTYLPGIIGPSIDTRKSYHCIYDIAGNIVFSGNDEEYGEARKNLTPGYYFIKHVSEDGAVTEEKIKIVEQ